MCVLFFAAFALFLLLSVRLLFGIVSQGDGGQMFLQVQICHLPYQTSMDCKLNKKVHLRILFRRVGISNRCKHCNQQFRTAGHGCGAWPEQHAKYEIEEERGNTHKKTYSCLRFLPQPRVFFSPGMLAAGSSRTAVARSFTRVSSLPMLAFPLESLVNKSCSLWLLSARLKHNILKRKKHQRFIVIEDVEEYVSPLTYSGRISTRSCSKIS